MTKFFRYTLSPLFLILVCPPAALFFWYTAAYLDGSFYLLFTIIQKHGFFATLYEIWAPVFWGSKTAWTMVLSFAAIELFLMKVIPGKTFSGPVTKSGFVPKYRDNGFVCYLITMALFCLFSFGVRAFPASIIYQYFGEIVSIVTILGVSFSLFLYFKGRFFPSCPDHSITGNFIFDYYWGSELYPRILGWDVKQFTNCRFGMMSWPIILLSFAAAQGEIYGLSNTMLISLTLQLIYVTKFFLWERGYLRSMDIARDRAGFYICYGCIAWVPSVYTSVGLYLVHHPHRLPSATALAIFTLGTICILMNFFTDRQKDLFRESKGAVKIWGKDPIYQEASFTTEDGQENSSLLLQSGFWGISRHFHYLPEILGAFCWSVPALFSHFYPYFYVSFLTVLLLDRTNRDEKKCSEKYQEAWSKHCERVKYRLIPYIW